MSAAVFRLSTRLRIRQPARIRHLAVAPEQRQMTVCFTGHRQLADQEADAVSAKLDLLLPKLYQQGYRRFFCGGALGFDTLAAEAVMRMQAAYSDVMLVMAIPVRPKPCTGMRQMLAAMSIFCMLPMKPTCSPLLIITAA